MKNFLVLMSMLVSIFFCPPTEMPQLYTVSKYIIFELMNIYRKQQGPCIELNALYLAASEFTTCLFLGNMIYFPLH